MEGRGGRPVLGLRKKNTAKFIWSACIINVRSVGRVYPEPDGRHDHLADPIQGIRVIMQNLFT